VSLPYQQTEKPAGPVISSPLWGEDTGEGAVLAGELLARLFDVVDSFAGASSRRVPLSLSPRERSLRLDLALRFGSYDFA
jgi:hypothetical protein